MWENFKKFWSGHPTRRKILGVLLLVIGIVSILTPFTPVGFLVIVGLELLGIREVAYEKVKQWLGKS